MTAPSAETAYLFRHAVLRDAAYQLHPPADRAALHVLAADLIEQAFRGPALDAVSPEVADHLASARQYRDSPGLRAREREFAARAAAACESRCRYADACEYWQRCASLADAGQAVPHLCKAASAAAAGEAHALCDDLIHRAFNVAGTDVAQQTQVLSIRAIRRQYTGQVDAAEEDFRRVLRLHEQAHEYKQVGLTLRNLSTLLLQTSRMQDAEAAQMRALELLQKEGTEHDIARTRSLLALTYQVTGRFELAEGQLQDLLQQWHRLGDQRMVGSDTSNLASLYLRMGRHADAERMYLEALAVVRRIGERRSEGITLTNLALVYQQTSRPEMAAQALRDAIGIHLEIGNIHGHGIALGNLGFYYASTSRNDEAAQSYRQAIALMQATRDRRFEGAFRCQYAQVLVATGQSGQARHEWETGAQLLRQCGDLSQLQEQTAAIRQVCQTHGVEPLA